MWQRLFELPGRGLRIGFLFEDAEWRRQRAVFKCYRKGMFTDWPTPSSQFCRVGCRRGGRGGCWKGGSRYCRRWRLAGRCGRGTRGARGRRGAAGRKATHKKECEQQARGHENIRSGRIITILEGWASWALALSPHPPSQAARMQRI